jgi:small subunit ribosomal protein S4e
MSHLKRQSVPKNWPVNRKGNTWVVRPNSNLQSSIPLLIILRDMLKIAKDRKEVKKALHEKNVLLNGKVARDEKNSVSLFDVITIVPGKKNYQLTFDVKGKFEVEEVDGKSSENKIAKITCKKMLNGKKTQLNFGDGRNVLSEEKCKTNDSAIINFKSGKVEKCLPFKENANAMVFGGKHAGNRGVIKKIDEKHQMVQLIRKSGEEINVLIKHLIIIE